MPAIVFDVVVLMVVLYLGWLGSAHGAFVAAVTLLEVYAALSLAILLYEPLAGLLTRVADEQFGYLLPDSFSLESWAIFLSFAVLLWGTLTLLWIFVHPKITPADVPGYPPADMGGGFLLAACAGGLTIGGALVTWSMCPLLGSLRVPARHMFFDVGTLALRSGGRFLGDVHEGRALPVYGEPPSRESVGAARLASEAAYDADVNGTIDDHEGFFDADGNGVFSENLYYLDIDGNRVRRVGMAEKYTAGRWDSSLTSKNRERPSRGQPPAAGPAASPGQPAPRALPRQRPDELEEFNEAPQPAATPAPAPAAEPVKTSEPADDF
jgi:hypothetical protein